MHHFAITNNCKTNPKKRGSTQNQPKQKLQIKPETAKNNFGLDVFGSLFQSTGSVQMTVCFSKIESNQTTHIRILLYVF